MNKLYLPGATAVGIVFKDGVVLGADKRFAYGNFILSRSSKKVFLINNSVGAACAGMISDMQTLIKRVSAETKLRELEIRRSVPPILLPSLCLQLCLANDFTLCLLRLL